MTTNCQVILTDDDSDDRMFLVEALQNNGFSSYLCEAENGRSLFDLLLSIKNEAGRNLPELVVLDLNMPQLSGFEVLKMLKNDIDFSRIPVVILTSSSRMEDEKFCKNAGCLGYLKKPHSISGYDVIAKELLTIINTNIVCD